MNELVNLINKKANQPIRIMEVCGTHTHVYFQSGIKSLLNSNIQLISGPGCPVCVTDAGIIDIAKDLLFRNITVISFGDMVRVPGSDGSLYDTGQDVRVIYSPAEIIKLAKTERKEFVFLGVGFETTAPVIASVIQEVKKQHLTNISFLLSLKRMEPIIRNVLNTQHSSINGLILPGHVAAITGSDYFNFVAEEYQINSAVCGFTPAEILYGIYTIAYHVSNHGVAFYNLYPSVVTKSGNQKALNMLETTFNIENEIWRGFGEVDQSGYRLKEELSAYDAIKKYNLTIKESKLKKGCRCKDVIAGLIIPNDCPLFKKVCRPKQPLGPCMVSCEGACSIYYHYGGMNVGKD